MLAPSREPTLRERLFAALQSGIFSMAQSIRREVFEVPWFGRTVNDVLAERHRRELMRLRPAQPAGPPPPMPQQPSPQTPPQVQPEPGGFAPPG